MKDIPAFPCHPDIDNKLFDGMTLRDYFAAKAMQEFIGVLSLKDGTIKAYEWADAMMKEREL